MLVVLAILYFYQSGIQATPLNLLNARQNTTLPGVTSSQPGTCVCTPTRSHYDIIWGCFVTIFACSWVSVHPNIPPAGEGWLMKILRRLELMVWAILTPELIIMWAMRQWLSACEMKKMLLKKYPECGWTRTHGYFLQMGGFVLYEGNEPKRVLTNDESGELDPVLDRFVKEGKLTTIKEEYIQDRSKGDGLAKALVIMQTSWFVIQCIARKAEGFAITQLELITVALAVLNGVMYFLWWNKPLDVHSTIAVHDSTSNQSVDEISTEGNEEVVDENNSNAASDKPTSNQRVDEILIQGNDQVVDENDTLLPTLSELAIRSDAASPQHQHCREISAAAWFLSGIRRAATKVVETTRRISFAEAILHVIFGPIALAKIILERMGDMNYSSETDGTHVSTFYAGDRDVSGVVFILTSFITCLCHCNATFTVVIDRL